MSKDLELPVEALPPEVRANFLASETSIFFNVAKFEHAQRVAKLFSESTMVPKDFVGNQGNCLIALNYAARVRADPFMMMQTMFIIYGKPGIEGKLVAALINQSNKYSEPLVYEWLDAKDKPLEGHLVYGDSAKDGRGCRAVTVDAKSGKAVRGPKISWKIVHEEGWFNKSGSKWKTIPELMFMYRAASWFANVHCPDVKLGMHTVEEIRDFVDMAPGPNGSYALKEDAQAKLDELKKRQAEEAKEAAGQEQRDEGASFIPPDGPPVSDTEASYFEQEFKDLRSTFQGKFLNHISSGRYAKEATPEDERALRQKWASSKETMDKPFPLVGKPKAGIEGDPAVPIEADPEDNGVTHGQKETLRAIMETENLSTKEQADFYHWAMGSHTSAKQAQKVIDDFDDLLEKFRGKPPVDAGEDVAF